MVALFKNNNMRESTTVSNVKEQLDFNPSTLAIEDSWNQLTHDSDKDFTRHPNRILTPEEIQEQINSPTGNWFKRLVANLQMAFLTARELMEMHWASTPVNIRYVGRGKSKRGGQADSGEVEKPDEASSMFKSLKDIFAAEYNKLKDLTIELTGKIQAHDRNVNELVKKGFSGLVQTLLHGFEDQLREVSETHASELRLDEHEVEEAFKAHREAFPALAPAEAGVLEPRPGFAGALRKRFEDKEKGITKEDACCALVDHQFMSRVSDNNPAVQQDAPAYRLLQRTYERQLLADTDGAELFKKIADEYNTFFKDVTGIQRKQVEVTERLSNKLRSGDREVVEAAQSEIASCMQQVTRALQEAYAGEQQHQQQTFGETADYYPPAPKPHSSRRPRELDEGEESFSSYTSPSPFHTRPTPSASGNGSAGG